MIPFPASFFTSKLYYEKSFFLLLIKVYGPCVRAQAMLGIIICKKVRLHDCHLTEKLFYVMHFYMIARI